MLSKSPVPGSQTYIFKGAADPHCDGLVTGWRSISRNACRNAKNLWIEIIV